MIDFDDFLDKLGHFTEEIRFLTKKNIFAYLVSTSCSSSKKIFQPSGGLFFQLRIISFSGPKNRKIRQLMNKRKGNVKLCWLPGHAGIAGNEEADKETKRGVDPERRKVPTSGLKRMD
jgi:hypothetical protein